MFQDLLDINPRTVHFHTGGTKSARRIAGYAPGAAPPPIDVETLDTSVSDSRVGSFFRPFDPESVIGRANAFVAETLGVPWAYAGACGVTGLNALVMKAVLAPGDRVLVERTAHLSVHSAVAETGADPIYLPPRLDPALGVATPTRLDDIRRSLDRNHRVRLVVLTNPTYFGLALDAEELRAIVACCHRAGAMVLVDQAHGDGAGFHPRMPAPAFAAGADFVAMSTHKFGEALAPGCVLAMTNDAARTHMDLGLQNATVVSTSTSIPILASVVQTYASLRLVGHTRFETALTHAHALRQGLADLGLLAWDDTLAAGQGLSSNPLRVPLDALGGLGQTGLATERRLQQPEDGAPRIIPELGDLRRVLFVVTYGNGPSDIEALLDRAKSLTTSARPRSTTSFPSFPSARPSLPLTPADALHRVRRGRCQVVPVETAIGQVAGETVAPLPPGAVAIVQGEVITAAAVAYLRALADHGGTLKGATDPTFRTIRVLRQPLDAIQAPPRLTLLPPRLQTASV